MRDSSKKNDLAYYRVVIIRENGNKEVRARNLYRHIAESVAKSITCSGKLTIERQSGLETN